MEELEAEVGRKKEASRTVKALRAQIAAAEVRRSHPLWLPLTSVHDAGHRLQPNPQVLVSCTRCQSLVSIQAQSHPRS